MATVAEQLAVARKARNLTIYQVAEVTKIRTDHIRALEEGNFNVFSAPVYIRGFVRTYAGMLKMDLPQVMAALDSELGRTEKFREPPPLTEQKKGVLDFLMLQLSKLNPRVALILTVGVIGLAAIYGLVSMFRHHQRANPIANVAPGVYHPPANSGETLPVNPSARHN